MMVLSVEHQWDNAVVAHRVNESKVCPDACLETLRYALKAVAEIQWRAQDVREPLLDSSLEVGMLTL